MEVDPKGRRCKEIGVRIINLLVGNRSPLDNGNSYQREAYSLPLISLLNFNSFAVSFLQNNWDEFYFV